MNNQSNAWKGKTARFLTAQTVSLFGSSLVQYAIIWHITLSTSSGAMMTVSTICGFLPQILISLFAGVWIDRFDRKKLIMLSDSVIALSTLVLAVLFLLGFQSIWLLFAILLVRSAGTGVQTPAVNAFLPQITPKEKLIKINGFLSTANALMMLLSPAASGFLLSTVSLEATFLIDVATAVIGVGITSTISVPPHVPAKEPNSHLQEIRDGFFYLKKTPFLKKLLLFQISVLFFVSPSAFLTPLMVSRTFGPEVWRLTASEMVFSAGAALGGIVIAAWGGLNSRLRTTALAGSAYGALMVALGISPVFPLYLIFNFLIGVTMPCYNAPITAAVQETADPAMQGRVFSLMQISTSCSLPLGMLFFGPLADFVRVQSLLIACGVLVIACTFPIFRSTRKPTS